MIAPTRIKSGNGRSYYFVGIFIVLTVLAFSEVLYPIVSGLVVSLTTAPVPDVKYASMTRNALLSRVKDQDVELERVQYQALLYAKVVQENAELRELLHAAKKPTGVIGRVISRPPRILYDTLLLDVGSVQGVSLGASVIQNDIAVGTISKVADTSSIVTLYSSPGSTVDVSLGEPTSVVVAKGVGGGAFELSLPKSVVSEKGSLVKLQGTGAEVLGVVVSESNLPTDVSKVVRVASPLSLSQIDFVQIIAHEKQP